MPRRRRAIATVRIHPAERRRLTGMSRLQQVIDPGELGSGSREATAALSIEGALGLEQLEPPLLGPEPHAVFDRLLLLQGRYHCRRRGGVRRYEIGGAAGAADAARHGHDA